MNLEIPHYKFEKLKVWHLSLAHLDRIHDMAQNFPGAERYNLVSQSIRAATSVSLNIAEGSTSQTDKEFARFVSMAIRSCIEVAACIKIAQARKYITATTALVLCQANNELFAHLQSLRKSLKANHTG